MERGARYRPRRRSFRAVEKSIAGAHSAPKRSQRNQLFFLSRWEAWPVDESPSINPYLSGNFAPVRSEDDYELEVTGEFPSDLRGAFYRNGPNPQFEPRGHYHWFTGDGMIHAFFVDGRHGRLSQPLRPHAEMAAGARGGQGAVRRVRPAGGRPIGDGQGQRRRQHQHRLARGPASGARGGAQAVRTRSREPRTLAAMSSPTGAASPPIPRSIPRPARWSGSAIRSAVGSRRPCPTA